MSPLVRAQDRLIRLLGNEPDGRPAIVREMTRKGGAEATGYWLQLFVSVGIATLGLVLGSTAVVIGAMLVAPLMGPIIGLAMGLASGAPFLILRSIGRVLLSVAVSIGGAALIIQLLPFHELNAEITARTSPTLLDLITAAFCALAGVYATLRGSSDTATTAAGTSISISLVPPLCACGFGVGIRDLEIARGAGLLFLTNWVAIVVVGTVCFVATGFNRVGWVAGAPDAKETPGFARTASGVFSSRLGPVLRFSLPFVLLALVYFPLRRALDEVAWEVRVRGVVQEVLAREKLPIVQSRVRIERHEVEIAIVILGTTADAKAARARVDDEIRAAAGVAPRLEILAVPDASAVAGLESSLLKARVEPPEAPPPPTPEESLDTARERVRAIVEQLWPADSLGEPLDVSIGVSDEGPLEVRVVTFGPAVPPATREALQRSLDAALARETRVRVVDLPSTITDRSRGDLLFVSDLADALRAAREIDAASVCVVRAAPDPKRRPSADDVKLAAAVDELLTRSARVEVTEGAAWSVRLSLGPCVTPPP